MSAKDIVLAAQGAAAAPSDPYFENVTLLLHGDGTNGGQNNTFIDSSTNNFTITRNGNTTQGSFSPYGDRWSNYFDGNGDYLDVGSSGNLVLDGNFTVEGWFYIEIGGSEKGVLQGQTSNLAFGFNLDGTNVRIFAVGGAENYVFTSTGISYNKWHHIAITRSGNVFTLFVDGANKGTTTQTWTFSGQSNRIGNSGAGTIPYKGYISNFRIVKGTAVYTSAFTPPTAPLTAVSGTSLLTCQSNRFIDNSSNNFTITRNGDVSVQRFSPFSPSTAYSASVIGGSAYFDGNTDALTVNGMSSSVSDFCIEMWAYSTVSLASGTRVLFGEWGGTPGNLSLCRFNGGSLELNLASTTVFTIAAATHGVVAGNWTHIAFTRSGSTIRAFVNGTQVASATFSTSINLSKLNIAGERFGAFNTECWAGYLNDSRVVIGSAVYTSNFTPPSAPLTAITNTSLLLNFTNAAIFDNAMMNDLETVGNAQISTSVKKYGTGSLYFDGSGDYLTAPYSPSYHFGSGDFTIEAWVYPISLTDGTIVSMWGVTSDAFTFRYTSSGRLYLAWQSTSTKTITGTTQSVSSGTWNHVAVTRSGSTIRLFVNGSVDATTGTETGSFASPIAPLEVGRTGGNLLYPNGYFDDVRITKGIARYTANFTPPSAAFPNT